jgi:hypothetical protein
VHSLFKLSHLSTSVSAMPNTATQTPISVSMASVERPFDSLIVPAMGSRRTMGGIATAWVATRKCVHSSVNVNGRDMFESSLRLGIRGIVRCSVKV